MHTPRRVSISTTALAALCGVALGLAAFAASAALWRAGQSRLAGVAAEAVLLAALAGVAAATALSQPARLRRARVPVGRAMPHVWWPPAVDPIPALAVCVGAPVAAGAGAAALLFH